ncbi:hypothetical protein [Prosthecomicrobium sp. N25]|uniref:hypothetical protein n=1 Tax=Prosthecomicrobium sp. N25 TaxID=3129254 RepID=UPI003077535D
MKFGREPSRLLLAFLVLLASALPVRAQNLELVGPRLDSSAYCAGDCAVSLFAGRRIDSAMSKMFGVDGFVPPSQWKWGDAGFVGLAVSKRLLSVGEFVRFEGEVGVGKRFGAQTEGEAWVALYGRWIWFPWNNYVRTSVAVSTGFNVATDVPKYEEERSGRRAYLLHYLSPEVTFAAPDSNWEVFARLQHRSGGRDWWGKAAIFRNAAGGIQFGTLGVRYKF